MVSHWKDSPAGSGGQRAVSWFTIGRVTAGADATRQVVPPDATAVPPELSVAGLTVRFGGRTALEDVSLEVRPGEVVALAGENGAGKTTLIRAIGGDVTPS